jgi:hypothetical protein
MQMNLQTKRVVAESSDRARVQRLSKVCYLAYFKNYRNKTNQYYDPANAAGLPPDLPVATDAECCKRWSDGRRFGFGGRGSSVASKISA